ncbi:MAG: divergent polysaccharide deacetylase family protein [Firmicutes bacterium]|nr:divergent polysaccharide deacetylase family protein [Bacillota bacterium]
MGQPQLEGERTSIVVFLAVFAFTSLGFAVLGLVLGPELPLELGLGWGVEIQILRPNVPDLEPLREFWQGAGYAVVRQEQHYELQNAPKLTEDSVWIQGTEKWVVVPLSHDLKLSQVFFQLLEQFLDAGWLIQMEVSDHGYTLGFWSNVEGSEQKVLALLWEIELLNPRNYGHFYGDLIPVMGELFDPEGYLKGTPQAPLLSIIIDDWGYATNASVPLLAYPLPLTVAVLPHRIMSRELSELAYQKGHEVILHQPMEALDESQPLGEGGIYLGMDELEIAAQLKANLESLPVVVGVNNHMGSRVTADSATMSVVLEVVKELGLFFVDSRTSNMSVVPEVAREVGIPFGVNNLFLDNESDVELIKGQLRQGLRLAKQQGHAVVIGHVRSATATALWEMVPELLDSGVQLVPVSALLQKP